MDDLATPDELRTELARRERELRAVRHITAALWGRTQPDELLQQAVRVAVETLDAAAGSILLCDASRRCLVFHYVHGVSPELAGRLDGRVMPADRGVAGRVFSTGEAMLVPDARAVDLQWPDLDGETGYHTLNAAAVALKGLDGVPIGVMEVVNRRSGSFDEADLAVLEILAAQAAGAIETARLHTRVLLAEIERERFSREIVRCVTHGRLLLVDPAEIPEPGALECELPVEADYSPVRLRVEALAAEAGLSTAEASDLILAVAEAVTNAQKHARGGVCRIYRAEDRLAVRVADRGEGIRSEHLPRTLFTPGFSTQASLGMGYTIMLQLVDRLWLATGPGGTVLQLEKAIRARPASAAGAEEAAVHD